MDYVDIIGAGFAPPVPGLYGNCRVYYDTSGVHHIGPLYQEWNEQHAPLAPPSEPIPPPEPAPQAPEPTQDVPQEVVPPSEPVVQSLGG